MQLQKRVSSSVVAASKTNVLLLALLLGGLGVHHTLNLPMAHAIVWPLSGTGTPDPMNTPYGSRINFSHWDFHNGLDLPAPTGTPIHAMQGGEVTHAEGADASFSSRHVVIKVTDPGGEKHHVYLHLDSIDSAVTVGTSVIEGQIIGTVGTDGAEPTNPHLHVEIRDSPFQVDSVHPLGHLPYTDTPNFTAPVANRVNRLSSLRAARLLFGAPDKNEGDLLRVEVDLLDESGATSSTRIVDFNDNTTVNQPNDDTCAYVNDIAVEGYQTSNMVADGLLDLQYGILARNILDSVHFLLARVKDVRGNVVESFISIPSLLVFDEHVDFEGAFPPSFEWTTVTSSSGTGTTAISDGSAAFTGLFGMVSTDTSSSEGTTQRAGIQRDLPSGRFEWIAEGRFNPVALGLGADQSLHLLHFLHDTELSVAARIRNVGGVMKAGIVAKNADGTLGGGNSEETIVTGVWRKWKLHLLRIGTRKATAVLYLDDIEVKRLTWNSTVFDPNKFRAGIGLTSPGATATVWTDDLQITEQTPSASTTCTSTTTTTTTTTSTTTTTTTTSTTTTTTTTTTTSTTTTSTTTTTTTTTTSTTTTTTTTLPGGVTCAGLPATIVGTAGNNVINGTPGPDVIAGLGGNDNIKGKGGNDVICGGSGKDSIDGGDGHDALYGEADKDSLKGGKGDDALAGGAGDDKLSGGSGADALDGGSDKDVCSGGSGTDTAVNCESTSSIP